MADGNGRSGLGMADASEPFALLDEWMEEAKLSELSDANAMALATATAEGVPSVRIVLLKRYDAQGFCFYTNGDSRKGSELRANAYAALCLHWKSRQRQVRVEGTVVELPAEDADEYFAGRQRMSQIGAWASEQSQPLDSREELIARTKEYEVMFPDEVPRPPYWTGFAVKPVTIEFWQEGAHRLHDRVLFTAGDNGSWTKQRLFP